MCGDSFMYYADYNFGYQEFNTQVKKILHFKGLMFSKNMI